MRDRRLEGAVLGEGADVQLVEHELVEPNTVPTVVRPHEAGRVDDPGGAEDALRLEARPGVRKRLAAVEDVAVVVARHRRDAALVNALPDARELVVAVVEAHGDPGRARRPDAELDEAVRHRDGPERSSDRRVGHGVARWYPGSGDSTTAAMPGSGEPRPLVRRQPEVEREDEPVRDDGRRPGRGRRDPVDGGGEAARRVLPRLKAGKGLAAEPPGDELGVLGPRQDRELARHFAQVVVDAGSELGGRASGRAVSTALPSGLVTTWASSRQIGSRASRSAWRWPSSVTGQSRGGTPSSSSTAVCRTKSSRGISAPSSNAAPLLGREHQAMQGRRESP